jgi:hypothetical protein
MHIIINAVMGDTERKTSDLRCRFDLFPVELACRCVALSCPILRWTKQQEAQWQFVHIATDH